METVSSHGVGTDCADTRRDMRRDMRRDVRRDVRRDMRRDVRRDMRRDVRRDLVWGDARERPRAMRTFLAWQVVHTSLIWQVGTNVNAVDEDGKTVLCVAACSGCCEAVKCLLKHGAQVTTFLIWQLPHLATAERGPFPTFLIWQVRMRCPDGREPLDFAVDASVRQLLLAEVEALRMGLLDELLAEEVSASAEPNLIYFGAACRGGELSTHVYVSDFSFQA